MNDVDGIISRELYSLDLSCLQCLDIELPPERKRRMIELVAKITRKERVIDETKERNVSTIRRIFTFSKKNESEWCGKRIDDQEFVDFEWRSLLID